MNVSALSCSEVRQFPGLGFSPAGSARLSVQLWVSALQLSLLLCALAQSWIWQVSSVRTLGRGEPLTLWFSDLGSWYQQLFLSAWLWEVSSAFIIRGSLVSNHFKCCETDSYISSNGTEFKAGASSYCSLWRVTSSHRWIWPITLWKKKQQNRVFDSIWAGL